MNLTNLGLLLLRIGSGGLFISFLYPNLIGSRDGWAGADRLFAVWERTGRVITDIGLPRLSNMDPTTVGGGITFLLLVAVVLFVLGPFFRFVTFIMAVASAITTANLISWGAPFEEYAFPLYVTFTLVGLVLVGPGGSIMSFGKKKK